MKRIQTLILLAGLAGGGPRVWAAEPPAPGDAPAASTAPEAVPATPPPANAAPVPENGTNAPAISLPPPAGPDELRLNFRGASLDMVLNYLSEAAGFVIVLETQPKGKVDVWSGQPLTRKEAVDLLNSVLNKNGYAAIQKGRTLTIVNKDEAKTKAIPVRSGGDPENIPDNDELVTQIIPVRFVEVTQLIKDIQPLVSTQTPMTANESGNAIVITDTQSNIRKVAEVIKAIDGGAEDMTVVRVFRLQHADPQEMADLLTNLFPDDSRSGTSQSPFAFGGAGGFRGLFGGGGRGGFPGAGGAGGANTGAGGQNQRIKKRNRVVAVADQRTGSLAVTASKDLMDQVQQVIAELDPDEANLKTVSVISLEHAEPQDAMQVLQDIFQKSGSQNTRNTANQNNALQNRSTQQSQQYNNTSTRTGMGNTSRGGGGGFGQ